MRIGRIVFGLIGVLLIGVTVVIVVKGTRHPSATLSIAIALSTAIAVPIGLASFAAAWKLGRLPDAEDLRTEAEAKARASKALKDASTAEEIKANMEAYIELRARLLEVDRRRREIRATGQSLLDEVTTLHEAESQIAVAMTQLPASVSSVLEPMLEHQRPDFPSVFFGPIDVGGLAETMYVAVLKRVERRRLAKAAARAPEAYADSESERT